MADPQSTILARFHLCPPPGSAGDRIDVDHPEVHEALTAGLVTMENSLRSMVTMAEYGEAFTGMVRPDHATDEVAPLSSRIRAELKADALPIENEPSRASPGLKGSPTD